MNCLTKRVGLITLSLLFITAGIARGASDIPALRDAKDPAERARIQSLINGAKAEGKLEWLGMMVEPTHAKAIEKGFNAYYGLTSTQGEYSYSASNLIVTRVEQLLQARRNNFDVVWMVGWAWYKDLLARNRIMRYESPMYKDYTLSNKAGFSMPGYWVSDAYTFSPMFNPKAMAAAGFKDWNPTSWWDFTDAKLKNKVSMDNISQSLSSSQTALGLRKVLGDKWFTQLVKDVKPVLYTKTAQGRDWVISGEYPVTLTSHAKNTAAARASGGNVKLVYPKEGVVLLPFAPIILADAPHPNTAKLFIDYIRSAKGTQTTIDSGALLFFGRPGVKSPVPDLLPAWENINVIPMNWDVDGKEDAIKEIQKWTLDIGLSN